MRTNSEAAVNLTRGFGLKMFSEDELYAIHLATLKVLGRTGIKVESEEALEIFASGGAAYRPINGVHGTLRNTPYNSGDSGKGSSTVDAIYEANPGFNATGGRAHLSFRG